MKQLKKTLLTLVALLAVTTGAWADDKKVVLKVDPITVANGSEAEIKVKMDYTAEKTLVGLSFSLYLPDGILLKGFDTKEAQDAARASALKNAFDLDVTTGIWGEDATWGWLAVKPQVDGGLQITLIDQDDKTPFVTTHAPVISVYIHAVADVSNVNGTIHGITLTDNENNSVEQGNIADVLIPFNATAQEPESAVPLTWDATAKTATLTNGMPAGNVTVSVEYFPQAALTEAPTAINDVPATTDGAIVKAGTVATIGSTETAQGTVMYYVSPTALDDAALLALAADQWTADVPTAESLAQGQAYVYYYVRGNDSDTDEENFSDGDILAANALAVTIAAEPTYAVTFADGVNPEPPAEPEWTASPNADVKKGQTVTVTYTGAKKVIGVKAKKKVEPKKLTVGNVTFYYDEGQTFTEAKQKYADLNSGWILNGPYISVQGAISIVLFKGESPVEGTSKIEPNAEYSWIDFS